MSNFQWIRFRNQFNYGAGDWEWREIDLDYWGKDWEKNYKSALADLQFFNDSFRGIELELLKEPPYAIIMEMVETLEKSIKNKQETLDRYKKLIAN